MIPSNNQPALAIVHPVLVGLMEGVELHPADKEQCGVLIEGLQLGDEHFLDTHGYYNSNGMVIISTRFTRQKI